MYPSTVFLKQYARARGVQILSNFDSKEYFRLNYSTLLPIYAIARTLWRSRPTQHPSPGEHDELEQKLRTGSGLGGMGGGRTSKEGTKQRKAAAW